MKILLVISVILSIGATTRQNYGNYFYVPNRNLRSNERYQGFPQQNYPQSRAPTVEIQEITPEWVCNNYVTGEVKYFGIKDVVTTRLSSDDVERLLTQGVPPNTNQNNNNNNNNNANLSPQPKVSPNNPFLNPTNQNKGPQTEPPNTDGTGIIEPRLG